MCKKILDGDHEMVMGCCLLVQSQRQEKDKNLFGFRASGLEDWIWARGGDSAGIII